MPRFRKKPVEIEAFEFMNSEQAQLEWPSWFREALCKPEYEEGSVRYGVDGCLYINTLEGQHKANIGDYIIQGVQGELYPCKAEIFAATYDLV
jgi:hypothetical protein